jgi:DNA replication regulator DPB11
VAAEQRRHIQEMVDQNGAEYHGDLTKTVTHLIAATPSGKKYEHALNWRMKIVSLEWLQQSLERGMVLDEALFNPTTPVEQRGQGAWDRREFPSPAPGKRSRDAEPSQALNPFRRKLRRSASTKMGSQSEALWAGITAVTSEKQHDENDDWTEAILDKQDTPREHTPNQGPLSPVREMSAAVDVAQDPHQPPGPSLPVKNNIAPGVFEGRIVFPYGFDDEKVAPSHAYLRPR